MPGEGNGLVVKVSKWRLFVQAWIQKLLSTIISAKVLITLLVVYVSHQLVVTKHTFDTVLNGGDGEQVVTEITAPYLTGSDWANLMGTVIVAYIGARVMPQVIEAVGSAVGNAFVAKEVGKSSIPGDTPEKEEEDG